MGDRDTQTQHEPSWWASDAVPSELGTPPSFGEPVEWPDAMAWEALFEEGPATQPAYVPNDFGVDLLFGSQPGGDDGGGGPPTEAHLPPLPASIWAPVPGGDGGDSEAPMATLGGSATALAEPLSVPAAAVAAQAGPGRATGPEWMRRLPVRHRSAAVVALACCVSLVVLGMFLSVRARDDLPTQTTQPEPTGDQIATRQPFFPAPQPTTTATTAPPASISLSDLIPADAAATGAGGAPPATTARATAPATTAAPTRSAAPSGGGGGGAAQQPTDTTAAPDPEPTSPATTSPASSNTTTGPTAPARTTPTFPDYTDYTIPSITMPDWRAPSPGSPFRTDN